jgi:symplekin
VKSRYTTLSKEHTQAHLQQQKQHPGAPAAAAEEDDDYEPEYQPTEVPQDAVAQAEAVSAEAAELQPDIVSLGPFVLPQPPPLTEEEATLVGKGTVERVFNMVASMEQPSKALKGTSQKQGFGRLAASAFDRDDWLTLLTRLATRASAGLDPDSDDPSIKMENGNKALISSSSKGQVIADNIRDMLYRYFLEDFRARINVAISWMNEEWYNDRIQQQHIHAQMARENGGKKSEDQPYIPKHYDRWIMKLLDGFFPYLDARDKVLIRFLSEVPQLSEAVIEKVKSLAKDPERVNLCVQALQ